MDLAVTASAWVFFLLFVFALFGKLDGWKGWRTLTADLPLPSALRHAVRFGVPVAEGLVAVLLALDFARGLLAAGVLLGLLAVAVAALVPSTGGRECNCFGAAVPSTIGYALAARNAALAVLASIAWLFAGSEPQSFATTELAVLPVIFAVALMATEFLRFRAAAPHVGERA